MNYYASLKSRKRLFKVSPFCAGTTVSFNGYDVASVSEVSNQRRKQRELESERVSVKDRMFLQSGIYHFPTKKAKRNKACCWIHWLRHQSQIRHQSLETPDLPCLAISSNKKAFFWNFFTNSIILFRSEGVAAFHFSSLHMHFKYVAFCFYVTMLFHFSVSFIV